MASRGVKCSPASSFAHADVVQGWDYEAVRPLHGLVGEVDARVGDMLDDGKETVVVGELLRLLRRGASVLGEESEFLEDVPHVVREAQKVLVEVGEQDALVVGGLRLEIVQRPLARVVVREARDVHEHVGVDAVLLHLGVDLRLRRLQQGIQTPEDDHRQNHVAVLSAQEHVPQNVIRDVPDQRNHLVVRCVFHGLSTPPFPVHDPAPTPQTTKATDDIRQHRMPHIIIMGFQFHGRGAAASRREGIKRAYPQSCPLWRP